MKKYDSSNLEEFKDEKFLINICDQEPIHIPGSIQSFGYSTVLGEDANIKFCSENIKELTGVTLDELIGTDISSIITDSDVLNAILNDSRKVEIFYNREVIGTNNRYDIAVLPSTGKGYRTIEFQLSIVNSSLLESLDTTIDDLYDAKSIQELYDKTVHWVKRVIGFDRVKLYIFDEHWNGDVVAEAKEDFMPSYLGMRFPASDIPSQARALYVRNRTRVIADVGSDVVPLLPKVKLTEAVDLSDSLIRSVSPIHIEYLSNMGIGASFSVSLIVEGKLIGLLACHHNSPKNIGLAQRKKSEIIGRIFSLELTRLGLERSKIIKKNFQEGLGKKILTIGQNENFELGIERIFPDLMEFLNLDGIGFRDEKGYNGFGIILDSDEISQIEEKWLSKHDLKIHSVNNLANTQLLEYSGIDVAGIIRIPISKDGRVALYGFRRPRIKTVNWSGGSPDNAKHLDLTEEGKYRVSPRKSFEVYKQEVKGESEPFNDDDLFKLVQSSLSDSRNTVSSNGSSPYQEIETIEVLRKSNLDLRKQVSILKIENLEQSGYGQKLQLALEVGQIGTWEFEKEKNELFLDFKSVDILNAHRSVMRLEEFTNRFPLQLRMALERNIKEASFDKDVCEMEIELSIGEETKLLLIKWVALDLSLQGVLTSKVSGIIMDITSMKKLQGEIEEVNYELAQFFNTDLLGTFIADENGNILQCNDYFLELLGYDRLYLEHSTLNWRSLSPIDQYSRDLEMIRQTMMGERVNYERQFFNADSKRLDVLFGLSFNKKTNRFYGMLKNHSLEVVERDKAERIIQEQRRMLIDRHAKIQEFNKNLIFKNKELENEIIMRRKFEQSSNLLGHAVNNTNEMVLVTDTEFLKEGGQPKITYANKALLKLSGYELNEIEGLSPRIFQNSNTDVKVKERLRYAINNCQPIQERLINESKDGREYVVDLSISPVFDDNGECINFIGIQKDVTEEVQRLFDLDRAREHFKLITENLPDSAVFLTSETGNIEFKGGNMSVLGESNHANVFEILSLDKKNKRRFDDWAFGEDTLLVQGVNENRVFDLTIKMIYGIGNKTELIILAQDVSLKSEMLQMREAAVNEAANLAALKTQFINTASHQLKTPMSSIELNLSLLNTLESDINNPALSKVIARLSKESRRLIRLMDDTLQISRINSDSFETKIETVDLKELIEAQIDLFLDTEVYRNRKIVFESSSKVHLKTDERLLEHAIHNIISNALKYSSEDVEIELVQLKGGKIQIRIKDRGIGIPKNELSKIRTEFFRASNSSKHSGTGLGLYLVQSIMERLDGEIEIESIENEGSTFKLTL